MIGKIVNAGFNYRLFRYVNFIYSTGYEMRIHLNSNVSLVYENFTGCRFS